ncbi:uncharacterized protein LOC123536074 isoform X1 [Mercenaria mercenaria]|uniref:uncharacterized protein LOC123536074 isoform X1 n=1 Tax=Mercenaria mercenaria TaxID=6596 RepID=UPI00234E912D|nr:uncharacterized protein LOC123536074 isoform X1 [Mercenaria mercenaria]XP_053384944.1 uncharacterized protein LOC123536074 isoform X1 [Mercenaria mercenaria]XP_053384945.1 uncharacterized protein LOC123536074 isoform X1 [Mercenaria mercenaria]
MALGADNLIDHSEEDHERLVNNYSVNSCMSENNEFTVTRSFGDRKYSTMCFKPSNQNMVDIVITQGQYKNGKPDLLIHHLGSQDIRRKYSVKAKFGVATVVVMLIVMLAFVLLCLLAPPQGHSESSSSGFTTIIEHTNTTALNLTQTASVSDGQNRSYTSTAKNLDGKNAVLETPN